MSETRTVQLPEDLCAGAEKKFGSSFACVEELLVFLLHNLLDDQAAAFDDAEQKFIEQRLHELGYL
ncbi:MAG TPA: hypothetical protein VMG31_01190 [Verrucomicrobiae bacterium]|nr:hypothetical protein [Verrucomicrobiae bacterium]